ncbi:DUF535 family protein [Roseateles flavus]|uniref:DUF535 family protein n=1 Tax=Roseateles flavus TaxID=3149041 RepID=A0ABV0GLK1_9BURK
MQTRLDLPQPAPLATAAPNEVPARQAVSLPDAPAGRSPGWVPPLRALRVLARRMELGAKDWLKLVVAFARHPRAVSGWLVLLVGDPVLQRVNDARLLSKVTRPYLDQALSLPERVRLLAGHYRWLHAQGMGDLACAAHAAPQWLYGWQGKDGTGFELQLQAMHDGHREGELSLSLRMDGRTLYTLTGLVDAQGAGAPAFVVGRLQGEASQDAAERMRLATKALHGCRPASLLVTAAAQWSQALGCSWLELVGNSQRIAINAWRRRRILADNERLWQEMGASLGCNGRWRLHARAGRELDLDSIPSRKRAEARRRHALLQALSEGLQESMRRAVLPRP